MKFDVIVVGAGPAGSTAAKFLSEKGLNVLLIDKEKFPRDKPCGGAIPLRILKKFKYIEEKHLVENYTYGAYIYLPSIKDRLEIKIEKPMHGMVLRKKFDHGLVKHAIDCGTSFLDSKTAKEIKLSNNKIEVIVNGGDSYESQLVIGADGIWSVVAKKSKLGQNYRNFGVCIFQETPMNNKLIDQYFPEKKLVHVHMRFKGLNGYGWVFPKKDHINIGVGELRIQKNQSGKMINIKEIFQNYIKTLKDNKIIPMEIKLKEAKCAALPSCHIEKTYSDRVLLCGEAAGFINYGGGGIDYAMTSGVIAANIATAALEQGKTSGEYLSKYERLWMYDFGKDIKLFYRLQKKFGEKTEKYIKLAYKDKKISELLLEILAGNIKLYKNKRKLTRRLLYLYLRSLIAQNRIVI